MRLSEMLPCPWVELPFPYIRSSTNIGGSFGKLRTCFQKWTQTAHAYTLSYQHTNKQRNNNTQRSQQLYLNRSYTPHESKLIASQVRTAETHQLTENNLFRAEAVTGYYHVERDRPLQTRLPDWGRPAPILLDSCGHWNNAKHNLINRLWKI